MDTNATKFRQQHDQADQGDDAQVNGPGFGGLWSSSPGGDLTGGGEG